MSKLFTMKNKNKLLDCPINVLWVLICLANQTGVDLTEELQKSFDKKTKRDSERHKNNPKLSEHQEDKEKDNKN